jgi:hypothetical protein
MLKEILEKIHNFGKMFFVDKQKVKFEGVKEAMVYTNYSKYAPSKKKKKKKKKKMI